MTLSTFRCRLSSKMGKHGDHTQDGSPVPLLIQRVCLLTSHCHLTLFGGNESQITIIGIRLDPDRGTRRHSNGRCIYKSPMTPSTTPQIISAFFPIKHWRSRLRVHLCRIKECRSIS